MKKQILILSFFVSILFFPIPSQKINADEIWTIGDSTSVGYDGTKNVDSWIITAGNQLNAKPNQKYATSGTLIQSNFRNSVLNFEKDENKNQATWVVVNMGVNDVNYGSANLNQVMEEFREGLTTLKYKSGNSKIIILLPQGTWLNGDNDTIRQNGFSLNQLRQAQRKIAHDMNLAIVEPVVTDNNHNEKLGDKTVHPNQKTYVEIGEKVAETAKTDTKNSVYTPYMIDRLQRTGYFNTLAGYRWLEKGQAYSGFRYYMGTYYYFKNGVRQNNQWINMWGHKYYVGSDGRAYQGHHTIQNKKYYFGNNNTFYLR